MPEAAEGKKSDGAAGLSDTALLEAVLFAAGDPVPAEQLSHILKWEAFHVQEALLALQNELDGGGRGLTLRKVSGGWQLVTNPAAYSVVKRLSEVTDRHISAPTMETLSIIAFKQPITKQEIEQIRGVRVERALQKLLELNFIEESGRKQTIGRPILYRTTDTFLQSFGLNSLEDLPPLPTREEAADGLTEEQLLLLEDD
ncbi:MAG: SMC-Scp complex subunit ScpB [Selenomonadaceae bacterium]|nr:SMC-Scp complex subunit ScpB [Selenomonadaceae bacterium]